MNLTKTLTITLFFLSVLFMMNSNHPLLLGSTVIMQCILMSMNLSLTFSFSWFSFLIFIIYLGGILMLFCYIISITYSAEPLIKKEKNVYTSFFIFMLFTLMLFNTPKDTKLEMSKLYFKSLMASCFSSSMKMTLFMMVFLLLIMILVVFMTEKSKSSMRTV